MREFPGRVLASGGRTDRKRRSEHRGKAGRVSMLLVWLGALSACALFWAAVLRWLVGA